MASMTRRCSFGGIMLSKLAREEPGRGTVDIEKGHLCRCFTSYLPFGCTETHEMPCSGFRLKTHLWGRVSK